MIKTAEYCRKGHPDRVTDIIADAILDECLKQDPDSRVAVEVFGSHGFLTIGGEITTKAKVDYAKIAMDTYRKIGYISKFKRIITYIDEQSPEISDLANEGAGDSGIVIGYACRGISGLPIETDIVKGICDKLDEDKKILPDGKAQITIDKTNTVPYKIKNITVSYQAEKKEDDYILKVIDYVLKLYAGLVILDDNTTYNLIHFKKGGFEADTGLTGRKNVLWYGPSIPIGGGAFAGKDATKVDRSGAYLARHIALNHLQVTDDSEALVEIAYVIGRAEPLYVKINGKESEYTKGYDVATVIKELELDKPIYKEASLKGHFGTNKFNWDI